MPFRAEAPFLLNTKIKGIGLEARYQCPLGLGLHFYMANEFRIYHVTRYQCPLGLGLHFYSCITGGTFSAVWSINALSG